ncbi:hypothetical protein F5Y00DRAFT_273758 [Daldinia vernicosa]|uniref:uncharacterized protein n=1 Tax=Daldinia vernicosa TaxID=114800 RepID=UPI002007B3E3|nr:uncharacterized protein F5Y00DRAFT_273758 [Daldinia vernicosa]KAI0852316.1 hypothetical protein F5Y00DRAFT_273758 [Daldinia vernicosa]
MATKARKVPQNDWDRHKETILNLFLTRDLSIDELVQTMDRDHRFSATVSQYEAQFRAWNARKNLKVHEWEGIFEIIDRLSSQDIQSRVVISGHPVSVDRVHRARRHCNRETRLGKRRRVETDLSDASDGHRTSDTFIEVQNSSGEWCQYTSSTHQSGPDRTAEFVNQDLIDNDEFNQSRPVHDNDPDRQHPQNLPSGSPWSFSFHTPEFMSNGWLEFNEGENPAYPMDPPIVPELQVTQAIIQDESNEDIISPGAEMVTSPLRLDSPGRFYLGTLSINDLPFERFERDSASERLILALHPSPWQDSALLSGTQTLVTKFVVEVATAMSKTNGNTPARNVNQAWFTLQKLQSIISKPQQEPGYTSLAQSSFMMSDVELYRILLFSIANGFMGLDGISLRLMFRFLNENSNINSLLSRWFQGTSEHFAKGLAEKLFLAAIEAGNYQATRFFLEKHLVDVNNTFYSAGDRKQTPLERAAQLRELTVVRELLRFMPNVNETAPDARNWIELAYNTALDYLIDVCVYVKCPDGSLVQKKRDLVLDSEYMKTLDTLIDRVGRVFPSVILNSPGKFRGINFIKKLLPKLAPSDYSEAISGGLFPSIIEKLPAEDALESVTKIISDCEKTNYKEYLSRFPKQMNWAIISAAKRGYIRLVQLLFHHAESLTQILSAAIRGGNDELIEFVLAQNPSFCETSAELINFELGVNRINNRHIFNKPRNMPQIWEYTTPLAEAIDAKYEALIRKLEDKGALEYLDDKLPMYSPIKLSRFESVVCAASRVGNIAYLRKLLTINTQIRPEAAVYSLSVAVEYRREDIIRLLLDSGIYLGDEIRAHDKYGFMIWLYEWNKPLFFDIRLAFPRFRINSDTPRSRQNLMSASLRTLDFFCQQNLFDVSIPIPLMEVAIARGEGSIIRHLCRGGIDGDSLYALVGATKGRPDMLRMLLTQVPPTQECIHRYGTWAVTKVIKGGDIESLDILLTCKAIDFKFILARDYTPLTVAIETDAAGHDPQFPFTTRLLHAGCDPNELVPTFLNMQTEEYFNLTPLLRAIKTGNKNLVQFLIDRGARVNKEATHGIRQTPIQAAAETADLDMFELLLRNGADINGKPSTRGGGTTLQFAAMGGNCNIAALLIDRYLSTLYDPPSTFDGRWPLEGAAERGRLDMIQFLWNASLGGFPIEQCRKAIKLAEKNGHRACRDLVRGLVTSSENMLTLGNSG